MKARDDFPATKHLIQRDCRWARAKLNVRLGLGLSALEWNEFTVNSTLVASYYFEVVESSR
jgi:hypothetical protein